MGKWFVFVLAMMMNLGCASDLRACEVRTPKVLINPGYQSLAIGKKGTVYTGIRNNDSADCGPSQWFFQAYDKTGGSSVAFEQNSSVVVNPGQVGWVPLSITAGGALGQHLIWVEAFGAGANQAHYDFSSAVVDVKLLQSLSEPCVPVDGDSHPYCKEQSGQTEGPYKFVKVPQVYFYANAGKQKVWVVAEGEGTWRVRLMHWSKVSPKEKQNHFHQVAHSDLSFQGSEQELEYEGAAGLYRYEVECENDCAGKKFKLVQYVP